MPEVIANVLNISFPLGKLTREFLWGLILFPISTFLIAALSFRDNREIQIS